MPENGIPNNAIRHVGSGYRRMSTPTFPTAGSYVSLKTEELFFGFIFAIMAYKVWRSLKGLRAYWKYIRAPSVPMVGVEVETDDDDDNDENEVDGKLD